MYLLRQKFLLQIGWCLPLENGFWQVGRRNKCLSGPFFPAHLSFGDLNELFVTVKNAKVSSDPFLI